MFYKYLVAVGALVFGAIPAAAATITVTHGASSDIPGTNAFQSELNSLGLFDYVTTGATMTLSGPALLTFHYMGAESSFVDHFSAGGGSVTGTETGGHPPNPIDNNFFDGVLIGSALYSGGPILDFIFTSSNPNALEPVLIGSPGFGIFIPDVSGPSLVPGTYTSSQIYFGYDDQIFRDDDNHDDFIVRVTVAPIPEPASWAMMIAGFALAGTALRRARRSEAISAS